MYLLDTHILLWMLSGNKKLEAKTVELIENTSSEVFFSYVSLWEIAIKVSLHKLELNVSLDELKRIITSKGLKLVSFDVEDLNTLLALPTIHKDPLDRLLVAQAKTKGYNLISTDKNVLSYFK